MKSLVLGSNSPRRKELLAQLGFAFDVRTNSIDETVPIGILLTNAAEYLAIQKNKNIDRAAHEIVLTADTVVIKDGKMLEKPHTDKEAISMIQTLSNGAHEVITGVCITSADRMVAFSSRTVVHFGEIPKKDIKYYVDRFNPTDKAGAYGIQEWIGLAHIRSIEGSFYNVVGLPTERVYDALTTIFQFESFRH